MVSLALLKHCNLWQIPDWEKEAVPEHVQQAAREMGEKAFKERYIRLFVLI